MSTKFYGNDYDYANFAEQSLTQSYQDKFKKLKRDVNNTIVASATPSIMAGVTGSAIGGLTGNYIGGLTKNYVNKINPFFNKITKGRLLPYTKIPFNPYVKAVGIGGSIAGGLIGHRLALPYTQNNIKNNLLSKTDKYKHLLPNKQETGNIFRNIAQNRLNRLYGRPSNYTNTYTQ